MRRYAGFDIGVLGEGENTLRELIHAFEQSADINDIAGLIFRDNGTLRRTGIRGLIDDLDTLPFPAWDLFPDLAASYRPSSFWFKKLPSTSLVTARGCYGK